MRRLLLASVLAGGGGALLWYAAVHVYEAPGPLAVARNVVVPRGDMVKVGRVLEGAGVVGSVLAFRAAGLATSWQGPIRAAELAFPAQASLDQVLSILRFAHPVQHRLTIVEGLTAAQVAGLLARDDALSGDVVLPPEGSVLPQTYDFALGASRNSVLVRAESAMHAALASAWERRATDLPLDSPEAALVLASIVERETALPRERPMVARVFLNRLKLGMRLQADPTAAYTASGGSGVLGRALGKEDLAHQDGYNTYEVPRLPETPICNPGLAAIEAVLHPADGDALYFVADGTGGHAFSDRLEDHTRNVARYRALGH